MRRSARRSRPRGAAASAGKLADASLDQDPGDRRKDGKRINESAFDDLETPVSHRAGADQPPVQSQTLIEQYPKASEDDRMLSEMGIIEITQTVQSGALRVTSAELVGIWGDMRKAGFDETLVCGIGQRSKFSAFTP